MQRLARMALITSSVATTIIDCAIRVHTEIGPGLFESVYHECLSHELLRAGLEFRRQVQIKLIYDGLALKCAFRADLVVENQVLVEIKSLERLLPVHHAQVLTYLRLSGLRKALLFNFNTRRLREGGLKSFVR